MQDSKIKKLTLNAETLRELTDGELDAVAGGAGPEQPQPEDGGYTPWTSGYTTCTWWRTCACVPTTFC